MSEIHCSASSNLALNHEFSRMNKNLLNTTILTLLKLCSLIYVPCFMNRNVGSEVRDGIVDRHRVVGWVNKRSTKILLTLLLFIENFLLNP